MEEEEKEGRGGREEEEEEEDCEMSSNRYSFTDHWGSSEWSIEDVK